MRYTIFHFTPGGTVIPKMTFSSRKIAQQVLHEMRLKYPWREYQLFSEKS